MIARSAIAIHGFGKGGPKTKRGDARLVRLASAEHTRFEAQYPVEVAIYGNYGERRFAQYARVAEPGKWDGHHPVPEHSSIWNYLKPTLIASSTSLEPVLPLFAYYTSDRLSAANAELPPDRRKSPQELSRKVAYDYAMDGKLSIQGAIDWLRREVQISLQENRQSAMLEVVTLAIRLLLPGSADVEYNLREENLIISFDNGITRTFDSLSDGQKVVLALGADLASRIAWLNPGLGDRVLAETPGIVLIDELDLHLHPRWQRRIVGDLKKTFPKFQFIASSHSPFIIQSLQPGELVNLDHGAEPQSRYWELGLEEIASEEMDVEMPQRSERYAKMLQAAERYFRLARTPGANKTQLEDAEQDLEEVSADFSDDPAYAAQIKLETLARKAKSSRVADETR